jgi:hypothetical protein
LPPNDIAGCSDHPGAIAASLLTGNMSIDPSVILFVPSISPR